MNMLRHARYLPPFTHETKKFSNELGDIYIYIHIYIYICHHVLSKEMRYFGREPINTYYAQMFPLPRSHETDKFSNELGDMCHHVLSKYVCSEDVDAHGNAGDVILFGWLKSSSLPARLSCCML